MPWQLEVAVMDLHLRQLKTVMMRVREQRNALIAQHKKKRKPTWDDETPLFRFVNLQQLDAFRAMIADWQKHMPDVPIPLKASHYHFPHNIKHHIIRTLAQTLAKRPPVFHISTLQLCRYLAEHSTLGTKESIRKALQRVYNM